MLQLKSIVNSRVCKTLKLEDKITLKDPQKLNETLRFTVKVEFFEEL